MPNDPKPAATPEVDGTPTPSPTPEPKKEEPAKVEGGDPAPTPTPEASPKDDKGEKPDTTPEGVGNPDAPKVPDTYELSIPEGNRVTPEELAQIAEIAKAQGWSNEDAQAELAALNDGRREQAERFLAETKADQVLGGENLPRTQKYANAALDRFAATGTADGDELRSLLTRTGWINKRAVLRFLAGIGAQFAEDPGAGPGSGGVQTRKAGEPLTTSEITNRLWAKK